MVGYTHSTIERGMTMNKLKELLKAIEDFNNNKNGFLTNELAATLISCAINAKEEIESILKNT